jgi:hypothetical protein
MSPLRPRPENRNRGLPGTTLGLLAGITLLAVPTAANAFNPTLPPADAQASEGCCSMDQDYTFRGYGIEVWDEAPTVSELDCPYQDDACLLNEADQISRIYRLQAALVQRAALERAQHFGKGPFLAEALSFQ